MTATNMINVRFDLVIKASDRDHNRVLAACVMPQVPDVGEHINILCFPFIVVSRRWAVARATEQSPCETYCFLEVVKVGEFDISWLEEA